MSDGHSDAVRTGAQGLVAHGALRALHGAFRDRGRGFA
jgi:hypothetical protein